MPLQKRSEKCSMAKLCNCLTNPELPILYIVADMPTRYVK